VKAAANDICKSILADSVQLGYAVDCPSAAKIELFIEPSSLSRGKAAQALSAMLHKLSPCADLLAVSNTSCTLPLQKENSHLK